MGRSKSADSATEFVDDLADSTGAAATVGFADTGAQTISYNADGTVAYVETANALGTWRQTFTYTGGKLTGVSQWVKQ